MRLVCLSDTHLAHRSRDLRVPDGDALLHAGDATFRGTEAELRVFFEWFGALPHARKFLVAGNHDWLFQTDPAAARRLVPPGVTYLEDSGAELGDLKIWGSPWQPEFCSWAFNLPRGAALRAKWTLVPAGVDVLVTHGPPLGILDRIPRGEKVGCADLLAELPRIRPRLHLFGHIHDAYGRLERDGTTFVNASTCDESYAPANPAVVVDL